MKRQDATIKKPDVITLTSSSINDTGNLLTKDTYIVLLLYDFIDVQTYINIYIYFSLI